VYAPYNCSSSQRRKLTQSAHIRILYSRELTPNSVLDIVNTGLPGMAYKSHVVTIHAPTSTAWRVLLTSSAKRSVGESLESLLNALHADLRLHLGESWCTFFRNTPVHSANTFCLQDILNPLQTRRRLLLPKMLPSKTGLTSSKKHLDAWGRHGAINESN
jgi:hypothetical protein